MEKSTRSVSSFTSAVTIPSGGGGGTVPAGEARFNLAPNVPAAIQFALTPGQANVSVPIDYTSTTGIKLSNSAIIKTPEIFDIESKSINLFNERL